MKSNSPVRPCLLSIVLLGSFLILFEETIAQNVTTDTEAKIINIERVELTEEAKAAGIYGHLRVEVTVDKAGNPKDPAITAGPAWPCSSNPKKELERFKDAVLKNVLSARYAPAVKNGVPTESRIWASIVIGAKDEEAEATKAGESLAKVISGGNVARRAISLPKPEYPRAAKAERAGGTVTVQVLIDENGNVVRAGTITGHPLLQSAARNAACNATFMPPTADRPARILGVVTYNFVAPR